MYVNTAVWQRDAACAGASGRRFLTLVLFKENEKSSTHVPISIRFM